MVLALYNLALFSQVFELRRPMLSKPGLIEGVSDRLFLILGAQLRERTVKLDHQRTPSALSPALGFAFTLIVQLPTDIRATGMIERRVHL